jgi:hypothetical protein
VQVLRLSTASASGLQPFTRLFIIIMRPLVFEDSQPTSSKTGQTDRQVPQRTHLLIDLRSRFTMEFASVMVLVMISVMLFVIMFVAIFVVISAIGPSFPD